MICLVSSVLMLSLVHCHFVHSLCCIHKAFNISEYTFVQLPFCTQLFLFSAKLSTTDFMLCLVSYISRLNQLLKHILVNCSIFVLEQAAEAVGPGVLQTFSTCAVKQ